MILLLVIVGLLVRVFLVDFPLLSTEEARIAFRGYTLSAEGRDELGRPFPILFNSLTDYQLPAVSYLTALGERFFGKTDFGLRIPFILIGTSLIFLVYKISKLLSPKKEFWLMSAAVLVFSPILIFLSKIPNESILLTFTLTLLFYLLIRSKVDTLFVLALVILSLLTSKIAWFVIPPFTLVTLMFYQDGLSNQVKINIFILCLVLSLISLGIFLKVPQSQRSLLENNFPIFSEIAIKNGIDRLRGQGLETGWPPLLERLFFNKLDYLYVGNLFWLSHLGPAGLFGGFMSIGALSKIVIVPFFLGLIYLIKKGKTKERLLILYPLILTFPIFFTYPNYNQDIISLGLPFVTIIVAFGFTYLNQGIRVLVITLMILEVIINLSYFSSEIKNAQDIRPPWIKSIVTYGYALSQTDKVAFSDDIVSDIVPFLGWYTQINLKDLLFNIPYPYKFRQTQIKNIQIIGLDNTFRNCGKDLPTYIFASKRDLEEIQKIEKINIDKVFVDSLDREVAYLLPPNICVN